jgi:hypothetical protein
MARTEVDPIAEPTIHPLKTMMKIFFSVESIALPDILPDKAKL